MSYADRIAEHPLHRLTHCVFLVLWLIYNGRPLETTLFSHPGGRLSSASVCEGCGRETGKALCVLGEHVWAMEGGGRIWGTNLRGGWRVIHEWYIIMHLVLKLTTFTVVHATCLRTDFMLSGKGFQRAAHVHTPRLMNVNIDYEAVERLDDRKTL